MVKVIVTNELSAYMKSAIARNRRQYFAKDRLPGLDIGSDTFPADLTAVFRQNVAKARRENKRVTGSLDREPAKG